MALITPIAKVRGHGSAHSGAHHWWVQRITAVALIPLGLWFVYSILRMAPGDVASVTAWFASPYVTIAMLLFVGLMCYHAFLGIQVVIEDYISCKCFQTASIVGKKLGFLVLAVAAFVAIIKLHMMSLV